ncbi:universal stress protein [Streptomyces sp. A7024]|uniref:Universal stress protein n=1 Tax=Streptomyces coryli TaxID=1128680 RepID=A0A6G4TU12_9ACTN|nr:universal stress protein [Streptomyces coryli]NGN62481.1 universal stress protein [Streptomyces coryli]
MAATPQPPPLHGRVVLGYDGSKPADRALEYAVDEAVRRRTGLEILCGDPWTPPAPAGEGLSAEGYRTRYRATRDMVDQAAEQARKLSPGLTVVASVTIEDAAKSLVQCSRTAGLTVVGTRGHGGFAGLLLGSVSQRVAARSESPLMVVRGDDGLRDRPRGTVLVGVQSNTDEAAVRFGFEEAQHRNAALHVLHAWQFPPLKPTPHLVPPGGPLQRDAEDEAVRRASQAVPRYAVSSHRDAYPDVRVVTDDICGSPSAALVEASKKADVIVLTAHRNPHRAGLHLGPVSHAVLHHAHCPVVLIPSA